MSEADAVITALEAALTADPGNVGVRAHLAELLVQANRPTDALLHAEAVLAVDPAHLSALGSAAHAAQSLGDPRAAAWRTMADALGGPSGTAPASEQPPPPAVPAALDAPTVAEPPPPPPPPPSAVEAPPPDTYAAPAAPSADRDSSGSGPAGSGSAGSGSSDSGSSDSGSADSGDVPVIPDSPAELAALWDDAAPPEEPEVGDLEAPSINFDDVGGMTDVKARLEMSFLAPMRNPEMRDAFGKSMRGGLLLWGPPGCGKTFIARACAGELGASFYSIGLSDVLDMYIGQSERNLTAIFDVARRNTPCVLFFDEIDAIGQKRSQLRGSSAMRGTVNQFLQELDGVGKDNDGVFVLAATNHPWDVDAALLRPGRLDRMMVVLPPDADARLAILEYHLRGKPQDRIDLRGLAQKTEGLSGADLKLLVDSAVERAMTDSISSGKVRPISQKDLKKAAGEVKTSTGPWMETARNYAIYSNDTGQFDDLLGYLKGRKR